MDRPSLTFKCVLLGSAGVGKSCLVARFCRNEFIPDCDTTVGAAFLKRNLTLDDADVAVEIWDTAGQERYRSLAPMYYRGAQAAIIVFDITSRESFEGAKTWTKELQRRTESGSMIVALCGNKTDLAHLRRVDSEEGVAFAREAGLLYVETSAKDATNVERLFIEVAKRVPRAASAAAAAAKKDAVALGGSGTGSAASGGGCC